MKSVLSLLLTFILIFSFCACNGNYAQIDLKKPINLPDDGIVKKSLIEDIKEGNAIAVFNGISGEFSYEWTIFGSNVTLPRNVNLSVNVEKKDNGVSVSFSDREDLGFTALLSIYLNEGWNALGATAYSNGEALATVSITGNGNRILNLPINGIATDCIILPDEENNSDNSTSSRPNSDGSSTEQEKYQTDPVPEGKPLPVEPEDQEIDKGKSYTCIFSIECSTILNNLADLDPDKLELIPADGVILPPTVVTFYEGESVFDVLQRVCKENGIHLEFSWTPIYNSAYIEGIHNLYEFDCGALSGWTYRVNGWYPNYGCSRYKLADGEVVEWRYTCDLGKDVGCDLMS